MGLGFWNWLLGGGLLAVLILWWIELFQFI